MAYSDELPAQKDWYNGIEFRSKLESKTAQALDNIGIRYEYEPKGYKLSNGLWYRPDFFLPDAHQFIECKGVMDATDAAKIRGLVEETDCPVLVVSYENAMLVKKFFDQENGDIAEYPQENSVLWVAQCKKCGIKWLASFEDSWACRSCGHSDKWSLKDGFSTGQELFEIGQRVAADKPEYNEMARRFNEN